MTLKRDRKKSKKAGDRYTSSILKSDFEKITRKTKKELVKTLYIERKVRGHNSIRKRV